MRFRYDPTSGALYFRLREGSIEETLELPSPGVYMDVNETGEVIGLEFLSLQEFVMFLSGFGGEVELPEQVDPEVLEGQMRLSSKAEPGSALSSETATFWRELLQHRPDRDHTRHK